MGPTYFVNFAFQEQVIAEPEEVEKEFEANVGEEASAEPEKKRRKKRCFKKSKKALKAAALSVEQLKQELAQAQVALQEAQTQHTEAAATIQALRGEMEAEKKKGAVLVQERDEILQEREEEDQEMCSRLMELEDELEESKVPETAAAFYYCCF